MILNAIWGAKENFTQVEKKIFSLNKFRFEKK
jgi:hypothetical protein